MKSFWWDLCGWPLQNWSVSDKNFAKIKWRHFCFSICFGTGWFLCVKSYGDAKKWCRFFFILEIRPVFCLCPSKILGNERRCYISNIFSHWLRPCLGIVWKQDLIWYWWFMWHLQNHSHEAAEYSNMQIRSVLCLLILWPLALPSHQ